MFQEAFPYLRDGKGERKEQETFRCYGVDQAGRGKFLGRRNYWAGVRELRGREAMEGLEGQDEDPSMGRFGI